MFNKKELTAIQEKLQSLEQHHDAQLHDLKNHHEQALQKLSTQLHELTEKHFYYFEEFERSLANVRELNIKYQKSIDDLNLFKNALTEKVLTKLEKDLKEHLDKHLTTLALDHTRIRELHDTLGLLKTETQRLLLLSQHIKTADFELTQSTQRLQDEQNEKIKLMHQVDSLQNLIAKIRRGQHG